MALSTYQKAVLQALDIAMYTHDESSDIEEKSHQESQQAPGLNASVHIDSVHKEDSLHQNALHQNALQTKGASDKNESLANTATLTPSQTNYVAVNHEAQVFKDLIHALSSDTQQTFKWLQGEEIIDVQLNDNNLLTPPLNKLSTAHKKQIWQLLMSEFSASEWS